MRTRRMQGFMCQSQASTAVCIPGDARSVVVPRKPDRTLVDHARVTDFKYSRLGDGGRRPPVLAEKRLHGLPTVPAEKRLQVISMPVSSASDTDKSMQRLAVPATRAKTIEPSQPKPASLKKVAAANLDKVITPCAPPPVPAPNDPAFQVVVLRVSIHCQGCAGKVKKHLSKMEGVTSFSIDLEAKRVTVMGRVSPADVLESLSKVKKAELWASAATAKPNNVPNLDGPEVFSRSHVLLLPSVTE